MMEVRAGCLFALMASLVLLACGGEERHFKASEESVPTVMVLAEQEAVRPVHRAPEEGAEHAHRGPTWSERM